MQFPCPQEAIGSSGDGEVPVPDVPDSYPFRSDYYKTIQKYCGQEQGSRLIARLAPVSVVRWASVSAVLREETLGQVRELLKLEDGWDGYGGYSPSVSACEYVEGVINRLASEFRELPSPEISPTPNGTLTLSWESSLGYACIEIGDERFSAYIRHRDQFIPMKGACSALGAEELQLISTTLYQ
jgi:hypothetical protein